MTTTAKVLAKGTKNTGLTEELAKKLYDNLGSKVLVIVELQSDKRGDDRAGNEHVDLSILSMEPVVADAEDHVRGLQRAMFMNRKLHSTEAQPTLDTLDDVEPKVEEVMAKGVAFTPHDYIKEIGDGDACNVCGKPEDNPLHGDLADGLFQEPDDTDLDDADDLEPEPHKFIDGPDALCTDCGGPAGWPVHQQPA